MEESELVPYAPDFTPATLGKVLGEDQVLAWLLEKAKALGSKSALTAEIVDKGLAHVGGKDPERNKRDMASHVIQGLQNYGLVRVEDDRIELLQVAKRILRARPQTRDVLFASHILTRCNGLRFVHEIQQHQLRGRAPKMEELSHLDRHRTSKSLSSMRAWLSRSGVVTPPGQQYAVDSGRLAEVLGQRTALLFGLEDQQLEFLLAARVLQQQSGKKALVASQVADLAETRRADVSIPRKALGKFVKGLAGTGLIRLRGTTSGAGGQKHTFELDWSGIRLADDELRPLLEQADFLLADLLPIDEVLARLEDDQTGRFGEMLAIHLCLMLGLRIQAWRKHAPHSEIDLIADRATALTYQRWAIQVKNTKGNLNSDRVDREIGAAAGSGVTHILFLVPRASVSGAARGEIFHRSRLTSLHIFFLTRDDLGAGADVEVILRALSSQLKNLAALKGQEAVRREES